MCYVRSILMVENNVELIMSMYTDTLNSNVLKELETRSMYTYVMVL